MSLQTQTEIVDDFVQQSIIDRTENADLYVRKITVPRQNQHKIDEIPIILLHGLLGSTRNFNSWATALSSALPVPREIYLIDLRNHGQSEHVEGMSYPSMAKDILLAMEAEGINKAFFIGHSMGGKVTCAMALLHPEKVEGAVVLDIAPVAYSSSDGTNWAESQKVIEALGEIDLKEMKSKSDVDNQLSKEVVNPALRAFALTNLNQDSKTEELSWKINLSTIKKNIAQVAEFDIGQGRLTKASKTNLVYKGNVLFVGGSNSRYIRSIHLKEIAKLFPVFMFQKIENAGHWVHAEKPHETVDAIKQYFTYVQNSSHK